MTISDRLFRGGSVYHVCGAPPNAVTIALRIPIWGCPAGRKAYTKRQMMAAPTNEIAIGMKMSDLAILSQRTRSASTATVRPKAVLRKGTTINQAMLLRIEI